MKRDWWKTFFDVHAAEVMFDLHARPTKKEVAQVLRRSRLKRESEVLDLACGLGRHSIEFARQGMRVTGLDYSPVYVKEARKRVKAAKLQDRIEIIRGDMKNLSPHFEPERFDAVVSLFNSFGYFDRRKDDLKVLKEMARILKPGGLLVLNTLNLQGVIRRLLGHGQTEGLFMWHEKKPRYFVLDKAFYDKKTRRTQCQWTLIDVRRRNPKVLRLEFGQNVYSHEDFKRALRPLGLKVIQVWGRLQGEPFDKNTSWHQSFVAKKIT